MQNAVFSAVDNPYTKQYAVFAGGLYCLYLAIRSIFVRSILIF